MFLLTTRRNSNHLVAACCEQAAALGVRCGMTLAHARSLVGGAAVVEEPDDPVAAAAALTVLARWANRFSPLAMADPPDGLLLDIAGCRRLFGDAHRHLRLVSAALRDRRLPARLACAPTIGCAWAAARFGESDLSLVHESQIREVLAPLPIAALRILPDVQAALADVGVLHVGELMRIPRDELAARFGPELLRRLDQATGEIPELINPLAPLQPLDLRYDFDGPITQLEVLLFAARQQLALLLERLHDRCLGLRRLELSLLRVHDAPVRAAVELTYPSLSAEHLWKLLAPQLERANFGFGVEALHFSPVRCDPLSRQQTAFWQEAGASNPQRERDLGVLLDRLIDRLGAAAVTRVDPVESHIPERAFAHVRAALPQRKGKLDAASSPDSLPRPSRLFDRPEPAEVIALAPDGPLAWIRWRGAAARVLLSTRPERIAFPWWSADRDEAAARDYYQLCDEHGRWLWVFRAREQSRWYVHGEWS